jgi:hypothetical protein
MFIYGSNGISGTWAPVWLLCPAWLCCQVCIMIQDGSHSLLLVHLWELSLLVISTCKVIYHIQFYFRWLQSSTPEEQEKTRNWGTYYRLLEQKSPKGLTWERYKNWRTDLLSWNGVKIIVYLICNLEVISILGKGRGFGLVWKWKGMSNKEREKDLGPHIDLAQLEDY